MAAAVTFCVARERSVAGIVMIGYGIAVAVLASWLHPPLMWMLSFWIAGAVASRMSAWQRPLVSIALFVATILISRFLHPAAYVDAAIAIATAILLADRSFCAGHMAPRIGTVLASFSYSLYAIHWPVMLFGFAIAQDFGMIRQRLPAGPTSYCAIVALISLAYVVTLLFAYCTEWRTSAVRDWLERHRSSLRHLRRPTLPRVDGALYFADQPKGRPGKPDRPANHR